MSAGAGTRQRCARPQTLDIDTLPFCILFAFHPCSLCAYSARPPHPHPTQCGHRPSCAGTRSSRNPSPPCQLVAYELLITPAAGLCGSVLLVCATSLSLGRVSSIVHPPGSMMRCSAADLSPVPASTAGLGAAAGCVLESAWWVAGSPRCSCWAVTPTSCCCGHASRTSLDVCIGGPNLPPTPMARAAWPCAGRCVRSKASPVVSCILVSPHAAASSRLR